MNARGPKKMTVKQQTFADLVISGVPKAEAYGRSYPNSTLRGNALRVEAHRTAALPNVKAYVDAALAKRQSRALLTRETKREILADIAIDKKAPKPARIMAIQVDNRMTGDERPVRVEGEITLYTIFQSMQGPVGLPSGDEIDQLKEATPVRPRRRLKKDDVGQTAMERAAG